MKQLEKLSVKGIFILIMIIAMGYVAGSAILYIASTLSNAFQVWLQNNSTVAEQSNLFTVVIMNLAYVVFAVLCIVIFLLIWRQFSKAKQKEAESDEQGERD